MSTVALACPFCGAWMRVAAQVSSVEKGNTIRMGPHLKVQFDEQKVAHICKEEDKK